MCYLLAVISFMPRGGDKDGEQMKEEKRFALSFSCDSTSAFRAYCVCQK